ncbi:YdcF family protein [Corynebacterium lubricantis]|uniref:YdcF family protein n=1 Tax=Corynebacterium lubricantis TaxID=541095 RepID=UPI000360CD8A|nr:YdcF family protein [Corynebacterium lubricantis]
MDPIVVLGAKTRDGLPVRILVERLKVARRLYIQTGPRPIIVSGKDEAGVMAEWLVRNGIPREDIVEENAATSTNENLENSRALAPDAEHLDVVTNNFHAARTKVWAWHLGIPISVTKAPTPCSDKPANYLRELGALPHSIARVIWRKLRHAMKSGRD